MRVIVVAMMVAVLAAVFGLGGPPPLHASTVNTIQRYHPGCSDRADPRGGDCTAAAHRLCNDSARDRLGFVFGRSPALEIACARHGWYGDVRYRDLAAAHPGCRGAADGQSGACLAAVRRYCTNSRGMTAGIVQEVGSASAGVACFRATRLEDVKYGTLARFGPGCRGASASTSLACFRAAARWCEAFGTGDFGLPQETGPTSLAVACLPGSRRIIDVAKSVPFDDN